MNFKEELAQKTGEVEKILAEYQPTPKGNQ